MNKVWAPGRGMLRVAMGRGDIPDPRLWKGVEIWTWDILGLEKIALNKSVEVN